ncbi:MAG TPA: ABC transporter ATP-binding protein [Candidatus Methylomirabilis sp.]|nr:ABC transporter ATP-binding protein [Candidatus Methylomirabilis sp.]
MAPPVINVDRLSKAFVLDRQARPSMLREAFLNLLRAPFGRRAPREIIWALRDVSLSVQPGEVLGIVGRNGAGKSTFLKVLSKITRPTAGTITVRGRVASLLEVGTGFHEELTGRENIYLSGSILGMPKARIDAKLDAIIDFAGVERFIDMPIKRYSSGMRLRLGFAVAANLESDILLVDEVLAVGDGEFQKKCLQAMDDLHGGGRMVLFVSHNLAAIENLCSRAIWIDAGQVRQEGMPKDVVAAYMATFADSPDQALDLLAVTARRGTGDARFTRLEWLAADRSPAGVVRSGDPLVARIHYQAHKAIPDAIFGFEIHSQLGTLIAQLHTYNAGFAIPVLAPGHSYIDLEIPELNLMPGRYYISLQVQTYGGISHDVLQHCAILDVEYSNRYGLNRGISGNPVMCFATRWDLADAPAAAPVPSE